MVRRRYTLTAQYSKRLSNDLLRIISWVQRNKTRVPNIKSKAMFKADRTFTRFCNLLIPYVYRTRVKRDIGRDALDLSDAQKHKLCLDEKKVQLKAFSGILDDVLQG